MNQESSLSTHIIATAIFIGAKIKKGKGSIFERIRWRETAKLLTPLADEELKRRKLVEKGLDPYRVVFEGCNPLTGNPVRIIFNQPTRYGSKLLMWNHLMNKWMFSRDAGLTWAPVETNNHPIRFDAIIRNVDLVLAWPPPNEDVE